MNSIAIFITETGGQKGHDAISKQHSDVMPPVAIAKDATKSIYSNTLHYTSVSEGWMQTAH